MPKRNFLIILCGLPASGKSTFAHKFKSIVENVNDQIVSIVDPDKIRKNLYSGNFNYKKEKTKFVIPLAISCEAPQYPSLQPVIA